MSTAQFCRARLVPFDAGGKNTEEGRIIPLDFNPETLTLKVSGGEQKDKGRKGRQQVQNVGSSKATLSFECVFDSTRPRDDDTGEGGGEEMLDVRVRTKPIADLVQTYGSGKEQAPRRVQFRWGTLIFNGVISSHQEVFEYFSPSGVPLRSKVQLTLTEQEFRYEVNASDAAQRRQAVEQAASDARSQASAAGADSLLGGGANGGAGFDLSAGFELSASLDVNLDVSLSAQVGLSASLGASADIGMAVGAGIHLDASAAIDLFGPAALGTSGDLGRSGLTVPKPSPGLAAAGVTPNPWAPDGPAPGSSAAGLATAVSSQRAAGAIAPLPAQGGGASTTAGNAPLPVRGSPPLALRRSPPTGSPLFATRGTPIERAAGERRPRWESLPAAATPAAAAHAHAGHANHSTCSCGGCGCRRCCGG